MLKTREELAQEIDDWVPTLETRTLTFEEFQALPEYSTTIPTGKTLGKQWRRQLYFGKHRGSWVMCTYVEDKEDPENYVGMHWEAVEIRHPWHDDVLEIRSCNVAHCTVIWFENRFSLHSSHDASISDYSCYPSLREK